MYDEPQLLQKLESCIEWVGNEFQRKSDDYFWAENDLVCRLLSHLWEQPEFMYEFKHGLGNGMVPLIHAEHKYIDLCLYDCDTAVKIVRDYANDEDYYREAQMWAGVQIEYPPSTTKKWQDACDDGVEGFLRLKQLENAYLVVFTIVRFLKKGRIIDKSDWYQEQLELLQQKREKQWKGVNLNIYCIAAYCVPCVPSRGIKPLWIR